ncbi:endonuclease/exonuclease/phosphatase family protein [Arenibacter certesii]|uniref:endonuclease/exonuclease/phosphatase family protein n=1 Tax=Arenibacter certesii TaxID=228955 RepID=UPI00146FBB7D|nr:endonuclease/exonuclease/phosphatase family protein [Arenibacter certesii]
MDKKTEQYTDMNQVSILSFNILQGGHDASNVGFPNTRFNGSRFDDLVNVILKTNATIVGVQEDTKTDSLLISLGRDWNRCYNIYSKFKLKPLGSNGELLNACRAYLPNGDSVVVVNSHWWPTGGDGPGLIKQRILDNDIPKDLKVFESEILEATKQIAEGPRGYKATIDLIEPYLEANEKVILVGDFNEPSHLDWTDRYVREGKDRWVKNPTEVPLRFAIAWQGSKALANIKLSDAYRTVNTDEVAQPGITWTPPYPNGTIGRQDYDNQELARIDRIYFNDTGLSCKTASVVTGLNGNGEIKLDCDWPSDHWAVLASFDIK